MPESAVNTGQDGGRLSGLVSRFSRQVVVEPRPVAAAPVPAETLHSSKTLSRFLSLVFARPAAELVDLGPVVGPNIQFLGERIGCKIHVEDLYADIDRHAEDGRFDQLPEFLGGRLALPDASVDAVLGWDVFDYLTPPAVGVLANELKRILRPNGLLLGFFGARASDDPRHTKYFIEDQTHLRYRYYPSACTRRWVLQNRDINNLFEGLEVYDTVLLKSGIREILFRKRLVI